MAGRKSDREKVTVSLPRELVRYADQRATELGTSRSQVIVDALLARRAREQEALAREGYAFFARESELFAEASAGAVWEALSHAG